MLRQSTLFLLLLLTSFTITVAQPEEFPWQVGRKQATDHQSFSGNTSTIRLAAPAHPDGSVTVLIYDHEGVLRAELPAVVRSGEVVLQLPRSLQGGVYMARIVSAATHTETKVIVPRIP